MDGFDCVKSFFTVVVIVAELAFTPFDDELQMANHFVKILLKYLRFRILKNQRDLWTFPFLL